MIATEPDTPLNDADHVGSFNLFGVVNYVLKRTATTVDCRRTNKKFAKPQSSYRG